MAHQFFIASLLRKEFPFQSFPFNCLFAEEEPTLILKHKYFL